MALARLTLIRLATLATFSRNAGEGIFGSIRLSKIAPIEPQFRAVIASAAKQSRAPAAGFWIASLRSQ